MSEHTPGPWQTGNQDFGPNHSMRVFASGAIIADAEFPSDRTACKANARLIAAAPELLEALKPLAFCDPRQPPYGVETDDWTAAVLAARAACTKAQGAA